MPAPRTRTLVLEWLPCPRLYDLRSHVVEVLDQSFDVQRFRVLEHEVGVALADDAEVTVDVHRLAAFSVAGPDGSEDIDRLGAIAEAVTHVLGAQLSEISFAYQHLISWDNPPMALENAYLTAIAGVLGPTFQETLKVTDMAVLIDGDRSGEGTYQAEFGVVDDRQAPLRLARMAGRMVGHRPTQHDLVMSLEYPPVATFVDSTWTAPLGDHETDGVSSRVRDELHRSNEEASELALALHEQMTSSVMTREGAQ
jgi:hypothetical protein